jgi:hypothetical protein
MVREETANEILVDELGAQIIGLAGRLASAKCRWLLLLARFDEREGCATYGLATTARWVAHYCGISLRTAVEYVSHQPGRPFRRARTGG